MNKEQFQNLSKRIDSENENITLTVKATATDSIMGMVLDACKDKLGRIKHKNWDEKVERRGELHKELNQLNRELSL